MDWFWLTPALIVALCALFIALSNYRRSNFVVVRVLSTRTSYVADVQRGQYHHFTITVQNLGIPLHNLSMTLGFSPEHGFGWVNVPLKTVDGKPVREGQFAKGAITEFTFTTDRFGRADDGLLRTLTHLNSQNAQLTLFADRYNVWSRSLHDRFWFVKRRWNRLAFWLTERFRRDVKTPRGTPGVKYLVKVPEFSSPGFDLLTFAGYVRTRPPVSSPPMMGHPFISRTQTTPGATPTEL